MIKLILVDDHQVILDGITAMLEEFKKVKVIATFKNGIELLDYLKLANNDAIVIMDISMPEMNGFEAMEVIQKKFPSLKVIMLSMHLSSAYAKKLLELGVKGYLQKDCQKEELIEAIYDISNGGTYLSENIFQILLNQSNTTDDHPICPKITIREKQVLKLIASEKSTKEIADILNISFNTVESHRKNLLQKFKVKTSIGLVREAIKYKLT